MNSPASKFQPWKEISPRSFRRGFLLLITPLLAILLGLVASFSCRAEEAALGKPLLWRIGGAKPSYVFGTIHLSGPRESRLAPAVQKAVAECDALLTEVPLDSASQMKVATMMMAGDSSLKKTLPKDMYDRTDAILRQINPLLSLEPLDRLPVWAFGFMLPLIEEQLKNPGGKALDAQLYARAETAGKQVGGIETLDEQMAVLSGFAPGDQLAILRSTLDDMEKAQREKRSPIEELRECYLSGDLAKIEAKVNEWSKSMDPVLSKRVMTALLTKRNHVMAGRIAAKVKESDGKSLFFAIGAAHLNGDEGVLKLLEKDGLKIERVSE